MATTKRTFVFLMAVLMAVALQSSALRAEDPARRAAADAIPISGQPVPEPPVRPHDLLPYAPAPPREPTFPKAEADAACSAVLADANLATEVRAAVVEEGGCGIAAPVALIAVILTDNRRVDVTPAPVMRCDLATRLGAFIREAVAPVTEADGRKIKRVVTADAYDCRGRNRQAGAKLSEHAGGAAIDLAAIEFADGRVMRFADRKNDPAVSGALRESACARFSTVLGPGSDGYHEDHVHLDLAQRRNGYKICQWALQ